MFPGHVLLERPAGSPLDFRQHMLVKDRNRDTAWYSLLDGEWPAVGAAYEAWLDPANFDADGRQKRSLAELRQRPA